MLIKSQSLNLCLAIMSRSLINLSACFHPVKHGCSIKALNPMSSCFSLESSYGDLNSLAVLPQHLWTFFSFQVPKEPAWTANERKAEVSFCLTLSLQLYRRLILPRYKANDCGGWLQHLVETRVRVLDVISFGRFLK